MKLFWSGLLASLFILPSLSLAANKPVNDNTTTLYLNGKAIKLPKGAQRWVEVHESDNGKTHHIIVKTKDPKTGKIITKTYSSPSKQPNQESIVEYQSNNLSPQQAKKMRQQLNRQQRQMQREFAHQQRMLQRQIMTMDQEFNQQSKYNFDQPTMTKAMHKHHCRNWRYANYDKPGGNIFGHALAANESYCPS